MTPPLSDMGSIPWKPVIPERKYQHLDKVPYPAAASGKLNPFLLRSRSFGGSRSHKIRQQLLPLYVFVHFSSPKLEQ